LKKAVFSLVALSLACSALLLPASSAYAASYTAYEQDAALQWPGFPAAAATRAACSSTSGASGASSSTVPPVTTHTTRAH